MSEFKKKRARRIDKKIIEVLRSEKRPISTREIALKTHYSWHTIINHCLRLQIAGRVDGYKLSNINVWVIKR